MVPTVGTQLQARRHTESESDKHVIDRNEKKEENMKVV